MLQDVFQHSAFYVQKRGALIVSWPVAHIRLQDGEVALFARERDVHLQERKGIANPFQDIGAADARSPRSARLGDVGCRLEGSRQMSRLLQKEWCLEGKEQSQPELGVDIRLCRSLHWVG